MNGVYFYAGEHERYPSYTRKTDDGEMYIYRYGNTRWFCASKLGSDTRGVELLTTAKTPDTATENWKVYAGGEWKDDAEVKCDLVEIKVHLEEEAKQNAKLRAEVFPCPSISALQYDDGSVLAVVFCSWRKRNGVPTVLD